MVNTKELFENLLLSLKDASEHEKLANINKFFNINIEYGSDIEIWNKKDYWATLNETLEKGCGDCDDIALAKYEALKKLNVKNLRLAYSYANETPHMVLLCNDLVLDSARDEIATIDERFDLKIIFSFDDNDLWIGKMVYPAPHRLAIFADYKFRSLEDKSLLT